MGHRLLARSLWPLGMALQTSVVVVAGWYDPDSARRAMGLTTVGFLLALLGLEQALPYRQDWSIRGDREIWRDIGHSVLYTGLGGNLAQIVFLYGLASALSRLGLAGGLGAGGLGRSGRIGSWETVLQRLVELFIEVLARLRTLGLSALRIVFLVPRRCSALRLSCHAEPPVRAARRGWK